MKRLVTLQNATVTKPNIMFRTRVWRLSDSTVRFYFSTEQGIKVDLRSEMYFHPVNICNDINLLVE